MHQSVAFEPCGHFNDRVQRKSYVSFFRAVAMVLDDHGGRKKRIHNEKKT